MEIKELVDHYKVLLNNEIKIEMEEESIVIQFTEDKFHHLAGIHKLLDLKEMFYTENGKRKRKPF